MTGRMWILGTVAAALAFGAGKLPAQQAAPGKPAAVVNGEVITLAELDPIVQMVIKERFKVQPPTELQRKQVQLEVLDMLINDRLLKQFLAKNGSTVNPADVDAQLAQLETSLKSQGRTLTDFYKETNQTEAQVRQNITSMLQWVGYVKSRITDADVQRYYEQNKEFFDQVTVRASHIVFRLPSTASDAERQATRDRLAALRQEIISGKIDFAEAAKKYSQCPSAPGGGDIGFFSRKWMVEEPFARAAFALKVGEISDIVQTEFGLHLIKVTDRKQGTPSDFAKIKDEVRDFCEEEMRQSLLGELRQKAKIETHLP